MLSNNKNTKGNIMQIGTMLDVKTIKNLEEIKSEKSFEEQYDEGLRRLNFNRQRMNEFKTLLAASKLPKQGRLETLRESYREYTDKEL